MSAWVLPDHIADVLPSEARHIEELRRNLLDAACGYGYELVIPPLLEHLESLLSGAGYALDLQTFKLVDQLSGRTLGLRADTTPQVARIDAHLLNRAGVTRLCYCGPVVHTRAERPYATREPLQFGAEIYGHQGLEADLESLLLALDCLNSAKIKEVTVDLGDARIARVLLEKLQLNAQSEAAIHAALASKDASELAILARNFPLPLREALLSLVHLYGDDKILQEAARIFEKYPLIQKALADLQYLARYLQDSPTKVTFDLADLRGYTYYSGARFAMYAKGASDALVRGGRYDAVGTVFGRNRPAVGFSLDLRELARVAPPRALRTAIRAPWGDSAELHAAITQLRQQGEIVVGILPGHESEIEAFYCDRELVQRAGQWIVQPV